MICQSCKQNPATVHLTEIVQKAKRETHLCEDCARARGITYGTQFSVKDFLSGLSKKQAPDDAPSEAAEPQARPSETFPPCKFCGITFSEFRQAGRLGCHHDYEHFQRGLMPLLEKIHNGNTSHHGRIPRHIGERLERERLMARFRKELDDAVQHENYERAAELRDKIKALEVGGAA